MPQDNIEVVRRLYEVWRVHGFGVVPELMDPDIEWVNPPYAVEPGTRHGHDGFAKAAHNLLNIYGDYEVSEMHVHEIGDRVVVIAHVATRSIGHRQVPIEADRGYVYEVRDGLVTRFAWFNDPAEALAAAEESA